MTYQPLRITVGGVVWQITHTAVEGYRRVFGGHLSLVEAEEGIESMLGTARPSDSPMESGLEKWRAGKAHHRAQLVVERLANGQLRLVDVTPPHAGWRTPGHRA